MGLGVGLVLRSGANTGGTDILGQILARYTPLSMGTSLFLVDAVIIAASAFIFSLEMALYAIMTVYIVSVTIVRVVSPSHANRQKLSIISEKAQGDRKQQSWKSSDMGETILYGRHVHRVLTVRSS